MSNMSVLNRRKLLASAGANVVMSVVFLRPAAAQSNPSKVVRIVVPFAAGGSSDILARLIAPKLQQVLGQTVVVENKAGASGAIGTEYVAKSDADGFTLLSSDLGSLTIVAATNANLRFDLERDLAPIANLTRSPFLLTAHPDTPFKTLRELIDYSRANPGKVNFASSGIGSSPHLAGLLFATRMGLDWAYLPSKGGSQSMTDVIGGQADITFNTAFSCSSFVKAGKLRLLAVSSEKRFSLFPEAPAMSEFLPGYETGGSQGLFTRAGTPPEAISRLNSALLRILAMPDVKEAIIGLGAEPDGSSPDSLKKFVRTDRARWTRLAKDLNLKLDR